MAFSRIRLGLPLGGINREIRSAIPVPNQPDAWAAEDIQGWRFETARTLRPLPSVSSLANTPNAHRITNLSAIRFGDSTADIVRHTHASFHELLGGAWVARDPAAGYGASANTDVWGSALIPSTDGKGRYMFSNGIVGPFIWDGSAGIATGPPASTNPARYIIAFADRAMLFNLKTGATISNRSAQWSIAGDDTTFTGTGSGDRDFTEFEGAITGVGAIRRSLFVYARNSIIGGSETFNVDSPVAYSPIVTHGIGIWAPNSLLAYNDIHAFLSEDGFRAFDGSQIIDIGAPIDTYILGRVNRNAINTVCGFVKPDWHAIFWAVPTGTSTVPNEGWWFDFKRQTWHRIDLSTYYSVAPTAFTISLQSSALPWNDPMFNVPWTDASMAGKRWIDFAGTANAPTVLSGHNDGSTKFLDEASASGTLTLLIETPDFTWEGVAMLEAPHNRPSSDDQIVGPEDMKTLEEVELVYRTISGDATLYLQVSTDGGQTFSSFGKNTDGAVSLPAGTGDAMRRVRVHGRKTGANIRVRLTSINPVSGAVGAARIKLEDFIWSVRKAGEIRSNT